MGANAFLQHLQTVLRAHPHGIDEHQLIKRLQADQVAGFSTDCLTNNLSLFQTHFLLFNALYQLADQLQHQGDYSLHIHTLRIQLLPASKTGQQNVGAVDPLREYYLDLTHLETTDAAGVDTLLKSFWTRYLANDERAAALKILNLQDPVDWPTIKRRHRQLAMQHHPDRGGDDEQLQVINAAMTLLANQAATTR